MAAPAVRSQSSPTQNPPQQTPPGSTPKDDNPFPDDVPKAPAPQAPAPQAPASKSAAPQSGQSAKPDASPAKPTSDNPFPGEDETVPIIPAPGTPVNNSDAGPNNSADSGRTPRRDFDPDGDPVRTPDPLGTYANGAPGDDGFSSSRSGLKQLPGEDVSDERPGKSTRNKTREQLVKEDVDVGSFYLDKKEWKGAQSRFQAAFALDNENPDVVWGLAEAERHLHLYKESAEHYKLFLSYDPDSKRGREARKDLQEVEAAAPGASAAMKPGDGTGMQPQ
jgi:tetratricopeptide (TPR) repeat protein